MADKRPSRREKSWMSEQPFYFKQDMSNRRPESKTSRDPRGTSELMGRPHSKLHEESWIDQEWRRELGHRSAKTTHYKVQRDPPSYSSNITQDRW
ncbi:hypothetical protein PCANC_22289 [Puccinia coronata f. sp. avenae]|uniref:Uncharacterized protein n=1 Tax=Puccinia coronata f. sp. avenae TaxID=200324 RepID=A0A2N5S961_9BASI|nr:hypothetical protein PCANC_22289 [Puccinia coronata f. sp. avenae]